MKKMSFGKKVIFTVISIFLLLIVVELFLGLLFLLKDVSNQAIHHDNTIDSEYLYYGFKPGAEVDEIKTNEDGFLTSYSRNKNSDNYRIVLIGGSVAKNIGKAQNKNGSDLLETTLRKKFNTEQIEVVNAGISGYVTEQEFILTQSVIQYYEPDLVISMDGYNDLLSININRYNQINRIPPQNYRDFKVIRDGKSRNSFFYRFRVMFKNTDRFIQFVSRYFKGESASDYSSLTGERIDYISDKYRDTVVDTYDFLNSKGIQYVNFTQPIRFYDPNNAEVTEFILSNLNPLYAAFEEKVEILPYCYSLTSLFLEDKSYYLDECHVNAGGHEIFADSIAEKLYPALSSDQKFQELIGLEISAEETH